MKVTLLVEIELTHRDGKFASKDEVTQILEDEVTSQLALDEISCDESTLDVTDIEVENYCEKDKIRDLKAALAEAEEKLSNCRCNEPSGRS